MCLAEPVVHARLPEGREQKVITEEPALLLPQGGRRARPLNRVKAQIRGCVCEKAAVPSMSTGMIQSTCDAECAKEAG